MKTKDMVNLAKAMLDPAFPYDDTPESIADLATEWEDGWVMHAFDNPQKFFETYGVKPELQPKVQQEIFRRYEARGEPTRVGDWNKRKAA